MSGDRAGDPGIGVPYTPSLRSTIADAIQTYWVEGMGDSDMAEWLTTQECAETATEMANAIAEALHNRYSFKPRRPRGMGPL